MKRISKKKINKFLDKILLLLTILVIGAIINSTIKEEQVSVSGNLEIYYFNVGQADSTLIKEKDKVVLIDAGNNSDGELLSGYIKEDLDIEKIDMLVATHPHEDHIGGMDDIVDNFDIDSILMPDVTTNTETFNDLLDSIEKKELKITIPDIGDKYDLNDMKFEVIYLGNDEDDLNNSSIILRLDYGNTSYLFTGDATSSVEKKILDKNINVDVLKVAHHGSPYSTTAKFLNAVSPKYAVIEVGDNSYGHPSETILKRLEKNNVITYRTDEKGTIKLTSDGKNIEFDFLNTKIDGDK